MSRYLPDFHLPQPTSQESRSDQLLERLCAARLAVIAAQTDERLAEIAGEIDAVETAWNKEMDQ
ncbi:hypothetical protein ACVSQB_23785 [Bradyrhizobium elkanii]